MRCVINSDLTSENNYSFLVSVKQTDLFTKADFDKSISFSDKILSRSNSAADHSLHYYTR